MRPVYDRLLSSVKRLAFLSSSLMSVGKWKKAENIALNAIGVGMFLIADEGTPEEIRVEAGSLVDYQKTIYEQARSEWLKKREDPKMSGKRSSLAEQEIDETLELLEDTLRDVQEEMKLES